MRQVVVGVDGSEASIAALDRAAEIAKETGWGLTVVHVRHVPAAWAENPSAVAAMEPYLGELETLARDRAAKVLGDYGLALKFETRDGDPVSELDAAAKEHDADLIVVSGHGNRGFNRLLLGSVTTRLVHTASVAVLVVR